MRYLMTFSYDGHGYNGYQKQNNLNTIQGEIEKVLSRINGNVFVSISASGRTDKGVHALNQKAHFDMDSGISVDKLKKSLNSLLPDDIFVKNLEIVDDNFHARFDVTAKEYIYKINMGEYNPIEKNYVYQYNKKLDVVEMERALKYIEGTHNFKSFTKVNDERDDYERTIFQTSLTRDSRDVNLITISILGSGFMRYMVRNLVGILISIGEGKYKSSHIFEVLEACDRTRAGITANPEGLYLKDVFYR